MKKERFWGYILELLMAYQQRPSFRCSRVGNQSVCSRKYAKRELQGGRRLGHHTKLSRLEDLQVVGVRASILFLSNCNLEILVFVENGKPENPENPPPPSLSEQEPTTKTTNSIHIWHPGYNDGRRALQPMPHLCSLSLPFPTFLRFPSFFLFCIFYSILF